MPKTPDPDQFPRLLTTTSLAAALLAAIPQGWYGGQGWSLSAYATTLVLACSLSGLVGGWLATARLWSEHPASAGPCLLGAGTCGLLGAHLDSMALSLTAVLLGMTAGLLPRRPQPTPGLETR